MSKTNNVLVYIQQDNGKIADVSIELISKAHELAEKLGVNVDGVIVGDKVEDLKDKIFPYKVSNLYCIEEPRLKDYLSIPYARAVVSVIKETNPQIVLFGATINGRDLAPRIASEIRRGLTADCTDLEIGDYTLDGKEYKNILCQIKPAFGGNIIATIVSPESKPQMASVREGVMKVMEPDNSFKGELIKHKIEFSNDDFISEILEKVQQDKKVNLTGASVIVAGGMGVGSKENFKLIYELANVLGAEVGATRAAIDSGFIGREHLIGQTGVTVRPKLYIACGISGSIQHTAGMEESTKIIAIDKDPDAPIFKIAHYGIVGDLNEVIPKMIKAYKEKH